MIPMSGILFPSRMFISSATVEWVLPIIFYGAFWKWEFLYVVTIILGEFEKFKIIIKMTSLRPIIGITILQK